MKAKKYRILKNIQLLLIFLLTCFVANAQEPYTHAASDKVDFEYNPKINEFIKLDTNNVNIWRIGKPDKSKFNSAYSGNNVIVTDLKKYYPPNIHSSFIMKFFDKYKVPDGYNYKIGIEGFYKIESDSFMAKFESIPQDGRDFLKRKPPKSVRTAPLRSKAADSVPLPKNAGHPLRRTPDETSGRFVHR